MLSNKHRAIFVHIPKTAGQSIEHVFFALLGVTWKTRAALLMGPNADPARGPIWLAHLRARDYVGCGHISQERFKEYFKFSIVRNPWDRVVSCYHFGGTGEKAGTSFPDYVERFCSKRARHHHMSAPQVDYIFDDKRHMLVDFVGRFENLTSDFAKICEHLKLGDKTLPHMNAARARRPYQDYFDARTRRFVQRAFAEDIERLGYSFD